MLSASAINVLLIELWVQIACIHQIYLLALNRTKTIHKETINESSFSRHFAFMDASAESWYLSLLVISLILYSLSGLAATDILNQYLGYFNLWKLPEHNSLP